MSLKLGMQHQALKYDQVCLNDDPRLTFDLFYGQVKFGFCCFCIGNHLNIWFLSISIRFCSKATGSTETLLHVEPPWVRRTRIYWNGRGHMTKIAAIPRCVKNIGHSSTTKFLQIMILSWPLTFLRDQLCFPDAFECEKNCTVDFPETIGDSGIIVGSFYWTIWDC